MFRVLFLWLTFRVFEMKETFKFGVDSKTAEKGPAQAIFTYTNGLI